MRYRLRQGVSFCTIGRQVILLDLPADRYIALGRHTNDVFNTIFDGGEAEAESRELSTLVSRGILVVDGSGTPIAPCSLVAMPDTSVVDSKPDAVRWTMLAKIGIEGTPRANRLSASSLAAG